MAALNIFQQVFKLSLASNAGMEYKGTQQVLQKAMQDRLPGLIAAIGDWKVVWGPVVWKHDPEEPTTGPDETWYIARNPAAQFENGTCRDTYVICVAGTATRYAWQQNIQVQQVVDFMDWVKNLPHPPAPTPPDQVNDTANNYVANGTAADTHRLLFYPAPEGAAGSGLTLRDFVERLHSSPCTFISTGHSRGGALSSVLALALFYLNAPPEEILAYPTASPSPGNKNFAALFQSKLPRHEEGKEYRVWNTHIFNRLDIVSQAWCTDKTVSPEQNLNNIPGIFGHPAILLVYWITQAMKNWTNNSKVTYYPLQGTPFSPSKHPDRPKNIWKFLDVARSEHINPYRMFFNIEIPSLVLNQSNGITMMTDEEIYLTEPVIASIAFAMLYLDNNTEEKIESSQRVEGLKSMGQGEANEEKKALDLLSQLMTSSD